MSKVFISGYFGFKNLGDELILSKMIEDIKTVEMDAEITIFSGDPDYTRRTHGVQAVNRFNSDEVKEAVWSADTIIVGGGGLIQEYTRIDIGEIFKSFGYNIAAYATVPLLAKSFQKPIFYWTHGVGPVFTEKGLRFLKWFYSMADVITVRDASSFDLLRKLYPDHKDLHIDTDPAMCIDLSAYLRPLPVELPKDRVKIGINVRPWYGMKSLIKEISGGLAQIRLKRPEILVIPIPFDLSADREVLEEIRCCLPEDYVFRYPDEELQTARGVLSLIGNVDLFLGMRLHGFMAARQLGIPTLSLSYDLKTEEFSKVLEVPSIKTDGLREDLLCSAIEELLEANRQKPTRERIQVKYRTPEIFSEFLKKRFSTGKESTLHPVLQGQMNMFRQDDFIIDLKEEVEDLRGDQKQLKQEFERYRREKEAEIRTKEEEIRRLIQDLEEYRKVNEQHVTHEKAMEWELHSIRSSLTWKIGQLYGKYLSYGRCHVVIKRIVEWLVSNDQNVKTPNKPADPGECSPYDRLGYLKEVEVVEVTKKDLRTTANEGKCSLVITIKNERKNIHGFLSSLEFQTLPPSEIVIVDGGSTDQTPDLIKEFMKNSKLTITLIEQEANIAQGRNLGARHASNEIILVTDAGCKLERDWCETMIKAFQYAPDTDLVAGIYDAASHGAASYKRYFIPDWEHADFKHFLPASRNVAFKKTIFERAGGYPEWLTLTGEDTLFDIVMRKYSEKWLFVKDLLVSWDFPATTDQVLKTAYLYNVGDGESGLGLSKYYRPFIRYSKKGGDSALNENKIERKMFDGFLEGFHRRISKLKAKLKGNAIIFSGVPLYDSGGAQRGAQLALELTRRGYFVTYINVYPSFEANGIVYMDLDISMIELWEIEDFDLSIYLERFKEVLQNTLVLLEFPHPRFLPFVKALKEREPSMRVIYDLIDLWESGLGWEWYTAETEKKIISHADVLICSAASLKTKLEHLSGRPVHLVPNGVNIDLFNKERHVKRPPDLPSSAPIIMYIGALWGQWFDWDLLREVSEAYGNASTVCIGDYKGQCPFPLRNVYFLGLKPQQAIPGYLKYADVCIIPFKINEVTQAVNPLKVYEYLAMGKAVVATDMIELRGMPGVYNAKDHREFIDHISLALSAPADSTTVDEFVQASSWKQRVGRLLELASHGERGWTDNP